MNHGYIGAKRYFMVGILSAFLSLCLIVGAVLHFSPLQTNAAEGGAYLTDGTESTVTLINKPITEESQKLLNPDPYVGIVNGGLNRALNNVGFVESGESAPALAADALAGSNDGKIIDLKAHYSDQGMAKLVFSQPVEANENKILTFRIWVDMDRNPNTQTIGSYHFYANRTDIEKKYFYNFGELVNKQRQWLEVSLTGQDILNLADEDGNIGALYFVVTTYNVKHDSVFDMPPDGQYGHIYIDEITYENSPDQGGYPYLTTMNSVTAQLDDNPRINDPLLTAQGGIKGVSGMVAGGLGFESRAVFTQSGPAGSEDGSVISFEIINSHQGLARLQFKQLKSGVLSDVSVKASEIDGLNVRLWMDVESDGSSTSYVRGNYYLMADRYNIENTYYYAVKVQCNQQRQWLDVIITGNDLQKLADEDGNIGALYFYYDTHTTDHPTGGHIYIDSIRYDSYSITYMNGTEKVAEQKVVYGDKAESNKDLQAPEGKVFAGWTTDDEHPYSNLYAFGSRVTSDVTLYAWWLDQTENHPAAGLYVSEDNLEISLFAGNTVYIKDLLPYGTQLLIGTDGESNYAVYALDGISNCFAYTQSGLQLDGKTYTLRDAHTVTYSYYGDTAEMRYALDGEAAENIAAKTRDGFAFGGWSQDGETLFDFAANPVKGDLNLVALWSYVESSDIDLVLGSYYSADTGSMIVLKENGVAQFLSGDKTEEKEFHYLVSDQLVFVQGGDLVLNYDALQRAFVYDGNSYSLLGKYFVMFYSDNVLIMRAEASEGAYTITAPTAPAKEGYVFKGWQTSDGTAFDPTGTVVASTSVYAVWEKAAADSTVTDPADGGDTAIWAVFGVTVAVVVAFGAFAVVLVRKKLK